MNLLVGDAPDYIVVGGKTLGIKTDFALWVKFILIIKEENSELLKNILQEIFTTIPTDVEPKELVREMISWTKQSEKTETNGGKSKANKQAFDFEIDGNVIFCELWQYFPNLMEKGVSFPQGLELIKMLMQNDNTVISHRAFARCGDFSKLSKEQRKYWQKERARYAIKMEQEEIDTAIASMF